jgi:hypothetical protein
MNPRPAALALAGLTVAGLVVLAVLAPSWDASSPDRAAASAEHLDDLATAWAPSWSALELPAIALAGAGFGLILVSQMKRWSP